MTTVFECSLDVDVVCTTCGHERDWPDDTDIDRHLTGDDIYAELRTACDVCGAYRVRIDVAIR